ncbi:MAG: hypothetical protein JO255_06885 [Alphaproteobacteria bacterium]|nr:hypothetical protein [Alphaproteobacteria bacterium]
MTARSKRPQSLKEVAARVASREQDFDPALREFLDRFYAVPDEREAAIEDEPLPLDPVKDAYLAAVAEHLARISGISIPEWSETHGNGLSQPFFAGGLESLKAILTVESPTAFRRRLLFVSKDALSRPRTQRASG